MDKEKLLPWIEKLTKATDKGERTLIVAEMCKENDIKVGDGWKFLKEAGFDPKAVKPPAGGSTGGTPPGDQQQGNGTSSIIAPVGAVGNPPPPAPPDGSGTGGENPPPVPGKKRIQHEKLKGKKLTVLNSIVTFDENGIVEIDAASADFLLTIPGYTEIIE